MAISKEQIEQERVRFEKVFPNRFGFEFNQDARLYLSLIGPFATGVGIYNDRFSGWLAAKQDAEKQLNEVSK